MEDFSHNFWKVFLKWNMETFGMEYLEDWKVERFGKFQIGIFQKIEGF